MIAVVASIRFTPEGDDCARTELDGPSTRLVLDMAEYISRAPGCACIGVACHDDDGVHYWEWTRAPL